MYKAKSNGTLTNSKDSVILGRGNDVGQYIRVECLNKLNSIPFAINLDMVNELEHKQKPSDTKLDYHQQRDRERAFEQFKQETSAVIDYVLQEGDGKMWFTHAFDKRGRVYSKGYHLNYQGAPYQKAVIEFADKEMLTEEGIKWLKVDIANCYGYDKETWDIRISKAEDIIDDTFYKVIAGHTYNRDDNSIKAMINVYSVKANAPELFIKAMYAYYKGVVLEQPIGHDMGLDSTASGEFAHL